VKRRGQYQAHIEKLESVKGAVRKKIAYAKRRSDTER
jgi:hypothetical protein